MVFSCQEKWAPTQASSLGQLGLAACQMEQVLAVIKSVVLDVT